MLDELGWRAPAAPMPPLTVAICTKDRPALLRRLLGSLLPPVERARAEGQVAEVLVVDNAPSDSATRDAVAAHPGVRHEVEPRAGLDFARNRALAAATGEWIAYLDDDVVVDRSWLDGLREAWTENQDAGAFTGLVLPLELATESQIIFEQRGGFRRGFEKVRYGTEVSGNPYYPCNAGSFGAGCNMAFRRDVLRRLGGFDEALDTGRPLPGGGDLDAFYRVVRAGLPLVYEPGYLVFHEHRRELAQLRRQYWSWGLGLMAFITKTWRADPAMRRRLSRLVQWWTRYQLREGARALLRRRFPVSMVVAELVGGARGLLGEYGRSQRRVERIREAHRS
jgi:GT2 family glycosyltransferase